MLLDESLDGASIILDYCCICKIIYLYLRFNIIYSLKTYNYGNC